MDTQSYYTQPPTVQQQHAVASTWAALTKSEFDQLKKVVNENQPPSTMAELHNFWYYYERVKLGDQFDTPTKQAGAFEQYMQNEHGISSNYHEEFNSVRQATLQEITNMARQQCNTVVDHINKEAKNATLPEILLWMANGGMHNREVPKRTEVQYLYQALLQAIETDPVENEGIAVKIMRKAVKYLEEPTEHTRSDWIQLSKLYEDNDERQQFYGTKLERVADLFDK